MSSLAEEVNRPVAVRHAILVVGFFLAATAFYTFPLILHSGDRLLIGLGDYPTETSMVVWNAQQTFRDPSRLLQPCLVGLELSLAQDLVPVLLDDVGPDPPPRLVSSVYRVVFWMLECPSHSCKARVSWPSWASSYPHAWRSMCG